MSDPIRAFWEEYVSGLPADAPVPAQPEAWGFGDSAAMADELARLVLAGTKTATCSLLWEYEATDEAMPQEGELSIILDGEGAPVCLIETAEVRIAPYDQVDEQFAHDEGEGDRSLSYWRDAHWRFFSRVCDQLGREPSAAMPLVCERFRVIHRASGAQVET